MAGKSPHVNKEPHSAQVSAPCHRSLDQMNQAPQGKPGCSSADGPSHFVKFRRHHSPNAVAESSSTDAETSHWQTCADPNPEGPIHTELTTFALSNDAFA